MEKQKSNSKKVRINIKSHFYGWFLGALVVYLFWAILDLITVQRFSFFLFLLYWDIMILTEVILIYLILVNEDKNGTR